ncbi:transferrin receptor protein 2-like, partial [Stegostoma tigrinum]|uniref:transferrin receptor protein 2-like n=1 Tax=Stegostoma tigrinum TaxID=3053191 RepID=UPI00287091BA
MEAFRSMLQNVGATDISFSTYRRQKLEDEQQGLRMEGKSEENEQQDPTGPNDMVGLVVKRSLIQRRFLLYLVLGVIFLLISAFILGYISSRRSCKACEEIGLPGEDSVVSNDCDYQRDVDIDPDPVLYWGDLTAMLKKYINQDDITEHIRMMSEEPHPSGSAKLHELTKTIHQKFNSYGLHHVWDDSHYVSLPFPDSSSPNYLRVTNANGTILDTVSLDNEAYLAYSPSGVVSGGLVYAHYGRDEDFEELRYLNMAVQGNIVILRAGRISLAEKVANAEQNGATGVLIYPDPSDYPQNPRDRGLQSNSCISGHVHRGTGDPFTPGFPSFNHTQFPPVNSSALPTIVALPISANAAFILMSKLRGQKAPQQWRGKLPHVTYNLGPDLENPGDQLQLSVSSRMVPTMISNVFGSIDGFSEPDRYIIFGAQRDAWSKGAAKSGVGTAILLELAHTFSQMVANGFKPRRSLLFASWDAGEFGSVGATEWLEGYLTMMHLKAAAYFSLDKTVLGKALPSLTHRGTPRNP